MKCLGAIFDVHSFYIGISKCHVSFYIQDFNLDKIDKFYLSEYIGILKK